MCSARPAALSPRSRLRQPYRRSVPQRAPDRKREQFVSLRALSVSAGGSPSARGGVTLKLLQPRGCPGQRSAGPGEAGVRYNTLARVCCSSRPLKFLPPYLLFLITLYFPFGFNLLCRVELVWKREGRGGILSLLW